MKILVLCVGKMKNPALKDLAEDYASRLSKMASLEILEIKDGKAVDGQARLEEEALEIEKKMGFLNSCILLDERGKSMKSLDLSDKIKEFQNRSQRQISFIIGSSHGLSKALKKKVAFHMKLSDFTLTHEMARMLLLEQIYRAHCILKNIPYHH